MVLCRTVWKKSSLQHQLFNISANFIIIPPFDIITLKNNIITLPTSPCPGIIRIIMPRTRQASSTVSAGKGGVSPKKKGNTSAASAAIKKRKTRNTTTITDDAVDEEPDGAITADIAQNKANKTIEETAVVAVDAASKSSTTITSPDAGEAAAASVVSTPRRGKKQKQGSLQALPIVAAAPTERTKVRRCVWNHCPFPHFTVQLKACTYKDCGATMHEQCLYKFEYDVGYTAVKGKVENEYFCPKHHPRKHQLSDYESEMDEDDDDKEDENQAKPPATNDLSPSSSPTKSVPKPSKSTNPSPPIPTLPPLPGGGHECDWHLSTTGCQLPTLPAINCQREECQRKVHHLCSIEWEQSNGINESSISAYCRYHHPNYSARNQLQLIPTGDALSVPSFSDHGDDIDENLNMDEGMEVMLDEFEQRPEKVAENNNVNTEKDEDDVSACSADSADSGDDGCEAEIHDAGTEFEQMENTIDDIYGVDFVPALLGAPKDWTPPGPPDDWVYVAPQGSPMENDIDNPANWNLYSFAPKFNSSSKKYEGHFTPALAKVVPINSDGIRAINDWKFYYNGWIGDEFDESNYVRDDAAFGNMKPPSRKGYLDVDILLKHGLNADRMKDDPLFFYQMLFPICDPKHTGLTADNRMPYFSTAAVCTNIYAATSGAGSGVGHDWVTISAPELVKWTACPIRNGALDGKSSTLHSRWAVGDPRYDPFIDNSMPISRWRIIKRFFKLNNNLMDVKKKGDDGYDPCSKYDFIYKVLVHNMNYVTNKADLDATVDESTWGFGGYSGECGGRLINKPVSRGQFLC